MKLFNWITLFIVTNLVIFLPYSSSNADELVWGENVGPVSAYVSQKDQALGLTIRLGPSPEAKVLGHIPFGTKIRGYNEFKSGWIKLKSPVGAGWVNIAFLKPQSLEGIVTKVDSTELCLAIRAGPASSHEKIGCGQIGELLKFTGIMTTANWVQLTDRRGWVDASSVQLSPQAPQAFEANKGTPRVIPVEPVESSSREKSVATTPRPGPTIEKKSGSEKAPAESALTSTPSARIVAPLSKAAQGKEELPTVACIDGWCVDHDSSQVTHNGKVVSGIECFKNEICAGIVGQQHAIEATRKGIMTFGNFKLFASGVILDFVSGKTVAYCNDKGSVDHKCVASFLRKTFAGISGESKNASGSAKGDASKETIKKRTENTSEFKKRSSTKSSAGNDDVRSRVSNTPSSAKDEQFEREMKMNEDAWDNARGMGL